eukprot:scaffold19.g1832.t1
MVQQQQEPSISLLHRSVAAAGASVVSAFVVNPLDVVKTRIQAQGAMGALPLADTVLEKWSFAACECSPPPPPGARGAAAAAPYCGPACSNAYTGTLDGLRKIARAEGAAALWRGTDVALLMAIPMVGIYLPLYDYLLSEAAVAAPDSAGAAPLATGALARTAAVCCTAPFEYVRTRMQAGHLAPGGAGGAAGARGAAAAAAAAGGEPASACSGHRFLHHLPSPAVAGGRLAAVRALWTGVGATLARDVPFSALYWGLVEPMRGALLPRPPRSEWEVLAANAAAGAGAGALAGAATTPLDVVKTRAQLLTGQSHPVLGSLRSIASREGGRALFRGWSARAAKAAPACAIVLSSYEVIKHWAA